MIHKMQSFDIILYVLLMLISLITLYPFFYVFSMSISSPDAVLANKVWLFPVGFSLKSYQMVFSNSDIWRYFYNSAWYAVVGTVFHIFLTMLGAYPLSNKNFCLRKPINILLIITMFFSGGIIPLFLLVNWMGLYNTRWALILPFITGAWNIIIARIYIGETIGRSLIEAAKIDGYNDIYILFKIVYPMSLPLLAYLGLQAAVAHWNSYFNALIFISEDRLQPIQIFLMRLLIQNSNEVVQQSSTDFAQSYKYIMQIKYAAIIVATLPIIAVYPFLQKYFVKGIMIGALK